jgi:hypothetical protein
MVGCNWTSVLSFAEINFMRTSFSIVLLSMIISCNSSGGEQKEEQSRVASRHSPELNQSLQVLLRDYSRISESLVNWNDKEATAYAATLIKDFDNTNFDELKKDTVVSPVIDSNLGLLRKDLKVIMTSDIAKKRKTFDSFSQNFYDLLGAIQYDEKKIYLLKCPMAFNDTIPAVWLSESEKIRNPYLGLHHPKYGKAMINCGEIKETMDFTSKK